jgi:hypothetical protein
MIYFIQAEGVGRVKIGKAKAPVERLRDLRVGCPVSLTLVGIQDGDLLEEKNLHSKFSHIWSHGEWFFETTELIEYMRSNLKKLEAPSPTKIRPDARRCASCSHTVRGFNAENRTGLDNGSVPKVCPNCNKPMPGTEKVETVTVPDVGRMDRLSLSGAIQVLVQGYECSKCGHKWLPRGPRTDRQNLRKKATPGGPSGLKPFRCPKCKSPQWDAPKLY